MKSNLLSIAAAISFCVATCAVLQLCLPTVHAQQCDPPVPQANPIEYQSCGTITYDLSYTEEGQPFDVGTYTVDGACYSYTDCDCNYQNGYTQGNINKHRSRS